MAATATMAISVQAVSDLRSDGPVSGLPDDLTAPLPPRQGRHCPGASLIPAADPRN